MMKTINDIDKNFNMNNIDGVKIDWNNVLNTKANIYGVFYDENKKCFLRMPSDVSKNVSEGVDYLNSYTAGGRIKFKTNSKTLSIHVKSFGIGISPNLSIISHYGISAYEENTFTRLSFFPDPTLAINSLGKDFEYEGTLYFKKEMNEHDITLYLPLYGPIRELYIGVGEGCYIKPGKEYKYKDPICFYGSSITEGGCASHPGNDYINILSRKLNSDILNLGFSGCGKAEVSMANYLAFLKSKIYVLDYDHNADNAKELLETHERLFKIIRNANPYSKIIFISKPDFDFSIEGLERIEIIKKTYNNAINNGDNNVYFIDGRTLFGNKDRDMMTVDGCHPNDLGFYNMAKVIYKVLKPLVK